MFRVIIHNNENWIHQENRHTTLMPRTIGSSRAFRSWLSEFCYFPPRRERLRSHSFLFSSFPRRIPRGYSSCAYLVFLQLDNSFLQFLRDRFYGPHRSAGRPLSTAGRRTRLCRRVPLEGLVFLREIALRVEGAQKSGGGKKRWRTFDYLISRTRLFLPLRDDVSPWMSNK